LLQDPSNEPSHRNFATLRLGSGNRIVEPRAATEREWLDQPTTVEVFFDKK